RGAGAGRRQAPGDLPPPRPASMTSTEQRTRRAAPTRISHVLVGTSGFSYPAWRGTFYPEDLSAREMLGFYARQLGTVEINYTFQRLPTPAPRRALHRRQRGVGHTRRGDGALRLPAASPRRL